MERKDITIRVDFFTPNGKWKYGGEVNIGQARLWYIDEFKQAIVDNQEIIGPNSWQGYYMVATDDLPKYDNDPEYREFSKGIFLPHEFYGIKKEVING